MKKKKWSRIAAVGAVLFILAFGAACGDDKKNTEKNDISDISRDNIVTLYHSDGREIVKGDDYLLKQPDSFNASVEEIVNALKTDESFRILSFEPDEYSNITLVITDVTEHNAEETLLEEAALVNTFSQINGMARMTIIIQKENGEEKEKNVFTKDSFLYYDSADEYMNESELTFYIPNESGKKLKRVISKVTLENGDSPEMAMLKYLRDEGVFSDDTEIISVFTRGGVCYINFSNDIQKEGKYSDELVLYSIVDSLTNTKGINYVRIYIDGDESSVFRGSLDISGMLIFEGGLIE